MILVGSVPELVTSQHSVRCGFSGCCKQNMYGIPVLLTLMTINIPTSEKGFGVQRRSLDLARLRAQLGPRIFGLRIPPLGGWAIAVT